jgi:hypothetical protein
MSLLYDTTKVANTTDLSLEQRTSARLGNPVPLATVCCATTVLDAEHIAESKSSSFPLQIQNPLEKLRLTRTNVKQGTLQTLGNLESAFRKTASFLVIHPERTYALIDSSSVIFITALFGNAPQFAYLFQ